MSVELKSAFVAEEADEYGADAITVEVENATPAGPTLAEKVRKGRSTKAIEAMEPEQPAEPVADALDAQTKGETA